MTAHPPRSATRRQLHDRLAFATLTLTSAVLQVPFLNRGISFYDEGSILAIADGLHNGELLYRDRVTLLPPFTYELMRVLFDVFGPSLLVGRVLQAVVFVLCTLLIYRILRYFMGPGGAFLGAVAFLPIKALAFPFWTVVNYSQIAMLFSLAAVALTLHYLATRRAVWLAAAATAIGMTVITKQNLGVFLTATVGVTVALDTLRERRRIAQQLVTRAAVLFAGSLPPITAVVALFGARGSLGDLVQRVILDLRHVSQLPPTPVPLRYGHLDPGFIIFTYFPAALIHLTWERGLDILSHGALFVGIGHAVQAIYVAPLVAMVVACIQLWRGRRAAPAAEWSGLLLLLVFAASSYASMLYRADWTHLMNIAPPLLLVCAVVFARLLSGVRWAAWVAVIACAGWLMIGIAAALAVFVAYDMPLDTPRGRLLGPRREVRDAAQVLAYVDRQSPGEHILFFRADPLYYFLTNRRIPIMLELVMPALLGPEDDAAISRSLSHVDQVIYNPKRYSTLATPVTEYIPHTARTLASDFRAVEALSPTAVVLKRRARPRQTERVVADFWDDAAHLQASVEADGNGELPSDVGADAPAVEHANWLMYRVLAFTLRQHNLWQCVATTHRVDSDETVAAIPLLNPLTWLRGDPDFPADASGARFRISVRTADGVRHTLYERAQPLAVPPDELHLALDRFAGQQVEIGFCATLPPDGPPGSATALAGWAEPRIVRTVDY